MYQGKKSMLPTGIFNRNNHCFFNSMILCLGRALQPFLEDISIQKKPETFEKYMIDTLMYMVDGDQQTKNVDLIWQTLSQQRSDIFCQNLDNQKPQDASEALNYIIDQAALNEYFLVETQDGQIRNQVYIFPEKVNHILIKKQVIQKLPVPNELNLKEVLETLDIRDPFIYAADYNQKQILDIKIDIHGFLNNNSGQQIYVVPEYQNKQIIWIRPMYNVGSTHRQFAEIQPFCLFGQESMIQQIANYFRVNPHQIELKIDGFQTENSLFDEIDRQSNIIVDVCINSLQIDHLDKYNHYLLNNAFDIDLQSNDLLFQKLEKQLIKFPEVLVLEIYRIKFKDGRLKKSNQLIKFPMQLNYTKKIYRLVGVINHFGNFDGGHYTAYIRHDKGWCCVDNEHVYPIVQPVTKNATLLFYN